MIVGIGLAGQTLRRRLTGTWILGMKQAEFAEHGRRIGIAVVAPAQIAALDGGIDGYYASDEPGQNAGYSRLIRTWQLAFATFVSGTRFHG